MVIILTNNDLVNNIPDLLFRIFGVNMIIYYGKI
jgi:hypothetical protein